MAGNVEGGGESAVVLGAAMGSGELAIAMLGMVIEISIGATEINVGVALGDLGGLTPDVEGEAVGTMMVGG